MEAYLAFEEKSEVKHEYYFENLVEMAGASFLHNLINGNLFFIFKMLFKDKNERVFMEGFKAFIKSESIFFYPDLMVSLPEQHEYYSTQPVLIAEVLSESTRKFDMVDKFIQYQKLDTLQYYLLAEPEKHLVIVHKKTADNGWQTDTYTSITDIIDLPTFQISIALKDIYQA
ncbi:MAG: Uma2 family endonuclease [Ferruginibacter sp.]|nr:Uma2 family endonuclease [Ferruginibacter sp.]